MLQQVPPALPAAAPRQSARGERRGSIYSTTAAPSRGPPPGPHEAAFTRTSSPPRLIVPGPSSFPPITCFMSDPSLGCLLSEKSVAPTKRQLSASLCCSGGALPLCLPTTAREGGEGAGERKWRQAGAPGAGTRRPACGKHLHLPAGATAAPAGARPSRGASHRGGITQALPQPRSPLLRWSLATTPGRLLV